MSNLYRRKPTVHEARQLLGSEDGQAGRDLAAWCGGSVSGSYTEPKVCVPTLEGDLIARVGDWVVKGGRGEFWPVRADIFAETYEAVRGPGAGAPITYAGHTWPSAYEWCLWIMQHNAAPGPAQNGQRAALDAYRAEVRSDAFREAADAVEDDSWSRRDRWGRYEREEYEAGVRHASNLVSRMVDETQAAEPMPLIVSRYDTAVEPAREEEPILTVGAIAEDGRPVALLFDEETRAKVAGWLAPADADRAAELERLRRFASVTDRRHDEIRARLTTVDIRDSAEAWDLGMAIIAILESPLHPDATPGFFLPGHTYRRTFHGQFVYFHVAHVGTAPDSILPTAFGWLRTERGAATWSPRDESDLHGWSDITEDGES